VRRKLLFFIPIYLLILSFIIPLAASGDENVYLVKTSKSETPLHAGATDSYKVKKTIPTGQTIIVTNSFVNSKNESWLHVTFDGIKGWIQEDAVTRADVKGQLFTTSEASIHIRKGALSTYKQSGSLSKGQLVRPIAAFTNAKGENWVQVNNGKVTGWIPLSQLEIWDPNVSYLNRALVTNSDTPLRRGASFTEKTVTTLKNGQPVIAHSFIISDKTTWYHVTSNQKTGWIPADQTGKMSATLYVQKQATTLHRGATKQYKVVATLNPGQQVKTTDQFINDKNELWYKVTLNNGLQGWVLGSTLGEKPVKVAYLTVDDGPTSYTNKLLNTLDQYHAKATFFMLNGNMNTYKNDVKRMVQDGHAVGSHSVTHDKNKFYRSPSSAVGEMITTRNTIKKVTGVTSNLMRTPYGSVPYMKPSYRAAMNKENFIMWDWNVDSLDWKYNSSKYVSHTLSQVDNVARKGAVPTILIHDRKATVDHLPSLLSGLQKRGYTLVPIDEGMKPHQFK
jgi:peptidoglycan/xylan/chitin deacetylase (PgdA/CDA1 family)